MRAPVASSGERRLTLAVCIFLILAVGLVFGKTVAYPFVNFDDDQYVYSNQMVKQGLTAESIQWALTAHQSANWHPLTWLSHILDWQLYKGWAGGHHLTNVFLHAANAVLLFLVLRWMTAAIGPSAFVAAVFAVHPLRAESVAWIAERKDVLCGLFFVLTLAAYTNYVRWRSISTDKGRRRRKLWYLAVMVSFALGLMAKPMLVTLPCVLLLLDYWPLRRMTPPPSCGRQASRGLVSIVWPLLVEKIPLFVLSAASCVVTRVAQEIAFAKTEDLQFPTRVANALVSYVAYLRLSFWPSGMAVLYPHQGDDLPAAQVAVALVVLVVLCGLVWILRRRCPYLVVGWLWYLGMLVPVIGLVQVGAQAMADRFTYLPQIGLLIALAWGVADISRSLMHRAWCLGVASTAIIAVLMVIAWRQTGFWCNSEALWTHAIECTAPNAIAQYNLGNELVNHGHRKDGILHLQKSVRIWPDYGRAHNNLAVALYDEGRENEAIVHFRKAFEAEPSFEACFNLGRILSKRGSFDEAAKYLQKASAMEPDNPVPRYHLGLVRMGQGRIHDAIAEFEAALEKQPDFADAHVGLGDALGAVGRSRDAIAHMRAALKIAPKRLAVMNNLAWLLATCREPSLRDSQEAVTLATHVDKLTGGKQPELLDTLAVAYAAAGRFSDAVATARKALKLAAEQHKDSLGTALRGRIVLYESGKPYTQLSVDRRDTP